MLSTCTILGSHSAHCRQKQGHQWGTHPREDEAGQGTHCQALPSNVAERWHPLRAWALTELTSFGEAPLFSSSVTMSVCPCWAAWCKGLYPSCDMGQERAGWAGSAHRRAKSRPGTAGQHPHPPAQPWPLPYLGLGIDICLVLQQELDQLDVSIVAGHMERGVPHLEVVAGSRMTDSPMSRAPPKEPSHGWSGAGNRAGTGTGSPLRSGPQMTKLRLQERTVPQDGGCLGFAGSLCGASRIFSVCLHHHPIAPCPQRAGQAGCWMPDWVPE